MVRRRRLVPVAIACAVGWALAPGAAQAAAAQSAVGRSAVAQAAAAAGPAARPAVALVDDIAPGPASSDPRYELVTSGVGSARTVSFVVAGVRLVADINPAGASPQDLTEVGGTPVLEAQTGATEVFSANDGRHGRQLWYSDGWSSNTRLATDINPGPAGSDPQDITAVGQVAYFTANDPAHGRELWKLTVPLAPQMFLAPLAPVKTGSPVRLTVTMELVPGVPMPTGSVTFFEDGRKIATRPLARQRSGGPTASLTIAARSGTHQIVAVYSGDGRYLPATSNTVPLTGN